MYSVEINYFLNILYISINIDIAVPLSPTTVFLDRNNLNKVFSKIIKGALGCYETYYYNSLYLQNSE